MTVKEAVRRASEIAGWCEDAELHWLAKQARKHERIVEVGVWQGRSAKVMAALTPGVVYAVDDFRGAGGTEANGFFGPGGFPLGVDCTPSDELEVRFRGNLAEEIDSGKLKLILTPSPAAVDEVPTPDMVYIDGDHNTEPVRDDLRAWKAALGKGGLLCGHDGPDPRVAEALRLEGIEYEIVVANIWAAV